MSVAALSRSERRPTGRSLSPDGSLLGSPWDALRCNRLQDCRLSLRESAYASRTGLRRTPVTRRTFAERKATNGRSLAPDGSLLGAPWDALRCNRLQDCRLSLRESACTSRTGLRRTLVSRRTFAERKATNGAFVIAKRFLARGPMGRLEVQSSARLSPFAPRKCVHVKNWFKKNACQSPHFRGAKGDQRCVRYRQTVPCSGPHGTP
ncbi:hypothetical protein CA51_51070 [Rosistilla oblonga]|nr:hypothetical protein CA51_51070 [Rosistilla oblonga]